VYRILWQYEVDADSAAEFERAYEESGVWCLFFRKGDGTSARSSFVMWVAAVAI